MIDGIKFMDDATRPIAEKLDVQPHQKVAGRHLRMIHNHYKGNMEQLRSYLDQVRAGEGSVSELKNMADNLPILENYRRFGNLCGQHCRAVEMHHMIEDQAIFPKLLDKPNGLKAVAERLIAEHKIVHALLEKLIERIMALFDDTSKDSFDAVVEVYDALERVLLSHFGYEEENIGDALGYFNIQV